MKSAKVKRTAPRFLSLMRQYINPAMPTQIPAKTALINADKYFIFPPEILYV